MNIDRIKKKYPYCETKATILRIVARRPEEGYVVAYDSDVAAYDLMEEERRFNTNITSFHSANDYSKYDIYRKVSEHALRHGGIVEEEDRENFVSKVYKHWYEYILFVEYADHEGNKYQNEIKISSEAFLSSGEQIDICYLIDKPQVITEKNASTKTIEDYQENRVFISLVLIFGLIMVAFIIFAFFLAAK